MKRSSRIEREGDYEELPKLLLCRSHRLLCTICKRKYGRVAVGNSGLFVVVKEAIHHILPCRWLRRQGLNPSVEQNLISICQSDHSRILNVETLLFAGDVYGFLWGIRSISDELSQRVFAAAKHYGLREFEKYNGVKRPG